jgi:hypothetical protein
VPDVLANSQEKVSHSILPPPWAPWAPHMGTQGSHGPLTVASTPEKKAGEDALSRGNSASRPKVLPSLLGAPAWETQALHGLIRSPQTTHKEVWKVFTR